MAYAIRGIPNDMVGKVWQWAEPFINRALDHTFGELSAEDIKRACMARDMQLWMIAEDVKVVGAGTTMIVNYPQMTACRIVTLAGSDFDSWRKMAHDVIEMWAIDMGCTDMESFTRKGFMPKLQEMGYRHRYSVAHKKLRE